MTGAFASDCTTRRHKAHRTEERKVFYLWHPWFGRSVFVHDVVDRGSARVFRCAETAREAERCLEVPEWMFERAACCGMAQAESPRVERAALERLKALIFEASGGGCASMVEARPCSLSLEGEADATPGPPSSRPTTRVVPARQAESGMAPTAGGCAPDSGPSDGAHAVGAAAAAGRRPDRRGARR